MEGKKDSAHAKGVPHVAESVCHTEQRVCAKQSRECEPRGAESVFMRRRLKSTGAWWSIGNCFLCARDSAAGLGAEGPGGLQGTAFFV